MPSFSSSLQIKPRLLLPGFLEELLERDVLLQEEMENNFIFWNFYYRNFCFLVLLPFSGLVADKSVTRTHPVLCSMGMSLKIQQGVTSCESPCSDVFKCLQHFCKNMSLIFQYFNWQHLAFHQDKFNFYKIKPIPVLLWSACKTTCFTVHMVSSQKVNISLSDLVIIYKTSAKFHVVWNISWDFMTY